MNKFLLMVISFVALGSLSTVHAQDGFAIWSKGGGCERELHYSAITDGNKVGEPKLVIEKGPGADIWPHISYDGEWIVWCRSPQPFKGKYGECDYHTFGNWEIYIARIDFGKILPVEPIHVANGYLPSWGEDAKTPNAPKTLYFTKYSDQTIQKTTINPDGSFTDPVVHSTCPVKVEGRSAHTQGSPDGKFILYRPNTIYLYSIEAKKDIAEKLGGCHPCWGPRSKYFIRSKNGAYFNTGTSVKSLGSAGVGSYFQGLSNDAYYDEGRLWVIGRIGGSGQNGAGSVEFKEVGIDGNGKWELGPSTKVGSGSACDIHLFGPEGIPKPVGIRTQDPMDKINNWLTLNTKVYAGANGLQLIINSQELAGYTAGLYDVQGKRAAFISMSGSSMDIIPLNGISNGKYFLKISNNEVSTQKSIWISR